MMNTKSTHHGRIASTSLRGLRPATLFVPIFAALSLAAVGCGGGPTYVAAGYGYGGPCYNCGYGYGNIVTVAGNGTLGNTGNGSAAVAASINQPMGVAVDASNNLYIADRASNTVREVAASTGIITAANPGLAASTPAPSSLLQPAAVAVAPSGDLYIVQQARNSISRVAASSGIVSTIAGSPTGQAGFSGDNGAATAAQLSRPSGIALDPLGNLYIADTANHRIRKIAANGVITSVAGSGSAGYSGDGALAVDAHLSRPAGVAVDANGNLYVADTGNSAIRKIDAATGLISTVAGNGTIGSSGDNALATAAQLNAPRGIAIDASGNLFIADTGNQTVREVVASTGKIGTIAGIGVKGDSGDGGPSFRAALNNPAALALDASGNMYIANSGDGVVRKIQPNPQQSATAVPAN